MTWTLRTAKGFPGRDGAERNAKSGEKAGLRTGHVPCFRSSQPLAKSAEPSAHSADTLADGCFKIERREMQAEIENLQASLTASEKPCEPHTALERIAREVATAVLERQGIRRVLVLRQSDFLRIVQELAASKAPADHPRSALRSEGSSRSPRVELLREMFRRELDALYTAANRAE